MSRRRRGAAALDTLLLLASALALEAPLLGRPVFLRFSPLIGGPAFLPLHVNMQCMNGHACSLVPRFHKQSTVPQLPSPGWEGGREPFGVQFHFQNWASPNLNPPLGAGFKLRPMGLLIQLIVLMLHQSSGCPMSIATPRLI